VYQNQPSTENSIDLSTTNKVVTVVVFYYSLICFKVVDGGSVSESAAEARHNGSGWQTLVLILTL
jgi:hypothetical protein